MGELSYINDYASFDPELFKSILEKLDTEQVSTNLVNTLIEKSMYNSALFVLQKNNCPQFTSMYKYECLVKLGKFKELLEMLLGIDSDSLKDESSIMEAILRLSSKSNNNLQNNVISSLFIDYCVGLTNNPLLKQAMKTKSQTSSSYESLNLLYLLSQIEANDLPKYDQQISLKISKDISNIYELIKSIINKQVVQDKEINEYNKNFQKEDRIKDLWSAEFSLNDDFDMENTCFSQGNLKISHLIQ